MAVRDTIQVQFGRARRLLARNRPLLEEAAKNLLASETLGDAQLARILDKVSREEPTVAAGSAVTA